MLTGYIDKLFEDKHYGFIVTKELNQRSIYFHFHKLNNNYKFLNTGDKVSFIHHMDDMDKFSARDISFISNPEIDKMKADSGPDAVHKGFIKLIHNELYVQDIETDTIIKLRVYDNEINVQKNYYDNLTEPVDYILISKKEHCGYYAVNLGHEYPPEFYSLQNKEPLDGIVLNIHENYYSISVLDKLQGRLSFLRAHINDQILHIGQHVKVTCISCSINFRHIVFDLTEEMENEKHYRIENEHLFSILKPGDKFKGNIIKVIHNFIYIKIEFATGVLNIYSVLYKEIKTLNRNGRRQLFLLFKDLFIKKQEINVIVYIIKEHKIFFSWDISEEADQLVYKELMLGFNQIKADKNYQIQNEENTEDNLIINTLDNQG